MTIDSRAQILIVCIYISKRSARVLLRAPANLGVIFISISYRNIPCRREAPDVT